MSGSTRADVVLVAAGSSTRMGGIDKLSLTIAGRSLLRLAAETVASAARVDGLVVVCAPERVEELRASAWLQALPATVVVGGIRRQDSVAAGVRATSAGIVLVHDAARPLVSVELVDRVIDAVDEHGAAIPVLPVVDALKEVRDGWIMGTTARAGRYRAQTPQGARRELLLAATEAYAAGEEEIADEAELLARAGVAVTTVPGDAANVKVTLPEDLDLARRLAGGGLWPRVTLGVDTHPFGPEPGLRLGGLVIEHAPRLSGHSDGDVVLHALCDALLAAIGGGDLGRLFPSGDPATRGIDSRELLATVVARVAASEVRVTGLDVTIVAARPRLGGQRLEAIGAYLARATGVDAARVSVKAATGNLSGDEGAGRAISASCLVTAMVP
jgi:2-C-methyl-D-erythritol 4-phosphate cytidylyltransferase/2-C-methyl-D-erythritol 2,4-cyclodiphosphate synthase